MLRNKVLLIDDEAAPRFAVGRFLKARGFDIAHGSVLDARSLDCGVLPAATTGASVVRRSGTLDDVERDYIQQVLRDEKRFPEL